MENADATTMEKIVSLAKRRGFIFQGSEIYGGLAGTWDYGPLGVLLKNNIKNLWWDMFVTRRSDMHGLDASILMNEKVWEASGHTGAGFTDPLVECEKCKKRFRTDHLMLDTPITEENKDKKWKDILKCPECGGSFGNERNFNLMFETYVGPVNPREDVKQGVGHLLNEAYKAAQNGDRLDETKWTKELEAARKLMDNLDEGLVPLRPETAQGIFVNFKNVVDTMRPKLPFGIAQIGKAFRNEIAPRDFIFRTREFEQMEVEYFIEASEWEKEFKNWQLAVWEWVDAMGLSRDNVREYEVPADDLAHYSKRTIDFEYNYPGKGHDELLGLAYRTDHDLNAHIDGSGEKLLYTPAEGEPFVPHVIEPSFGVDRAVMAVLSEAYTEDEMDGETRVFLKFKPELAPVKVAVFPLLKNRPELVEKAREIYDQLKDVVPQIMFDDHGNVGKRYRRQDEIGTPYCITIDYDTLEDNTVTVRERDTGEQKRIAVSEIDEYVTRS